MARSSVDGRSIRIICDANQSTLYQSKRRLCIYIRCRWLCKCEIPSKVEVRAMIITREEGGPVSKIIEIGNYVIDQDIQRFLLNEMHIKEEII